MVSSSIWIRTGVCGAWMMGTMLACGPKEPGGDDTTGGDTSSSTGGDTSTGGDSPIPTSGSTAGPTEGGETGSTSSGQETSTDSTGPGPGIPDDEIPTDPGPYLPGIDGALVVEEARSFAGGTQVSEGAGAWAQFFNAGGAQGFVVGDELDPFEGEEDCGVALFEGITEGAGDVIEFLSADEVRVEVGGAMRTMDHGSDLFHHWTGLTLPAEDPAPGSRFAFEIRGGLVGDADLAGPTIPPELRFTAPNFDAPIGRSDLALQWTGTGAAPLDLRLVISDEPHTPQRYAEIHCRMTDDGAFTIPAAILGLVPHDGFVSLYSARYLDELQTDNGRTYLARGASAVDVQTGFGEACDNPDNLAACEAAAAEINAIHEECGIAPLPVASQCPAFLADLCLDCTGYYACHVTGFSCEPDGLHTSDPGCQCE